MSSANRLFFPALICTFASVLAILASRLTGVREVGIFSNYFLVLPQAAVLVFLFWCALPFLRPREFRALSPFQAAAALVRVRWPLLFFPFFLLPIFFASYTLAKSCIPLLFGFRWEGFLSDLDRSIFGQDPWRITHRLIGPTGSRLLSIFYTTVWSLLFVFVGPVVNFFGSVETALRFQTARMITWMGGGLVAASFFSSSGPVFAQLADPVLGLHFAPLLKSLSVLMPSTDPILMGQAYLRQSYDTLEAVWAGGISAMPSMHVATSALYVCLAWRTKWRTPALIHWAVIWTASIHFGYHYATDGLAGSLIAVTAWRISVDRRTTRRCEIKVKAPFDVARLPIEKATMPVRTTELARSQSWGEG
jgi:hypothetical protein